MLAGLERRDRHLGMELIRRGDRDDVDIRCGDGVAPVGRWTRRSRTRARVARRVRRSPRTAWRAGARHIAEDRGDRVPGQRMAFAHVAGADQADARARACEFSGGCRHDRRPMVRARTVLASRPCRRAPPRAPAVPCRPPSGSAARRWLISPFAYRCRACVPRLSTVKRSPTA